MGERSGKVHALEFGCQAPLKFYEECSICPQFDLDCPDLTQGIELLRDKKSIAYDIDGGSEKDIHAGSFKCSVPLYYFENTRRNCGHRGRCREEGLLLALLSGKKELDYVQKSAIELPVSKKEKRAGRVKKTEAKRVANR
jgi:hypothetical protein